MPLPTPRLYATPADYSQYVGAGGVIPARLDYQLRLASKVIDYAMTGAVYDTDPVTLLPTDPDVAAMMCEATCQQAEFQAEIDDPTGAKDRYDQVDHGLAHSIQSFPNTGARSSRRRSSFAMVMSRTGTVVLAMTT